MAFLKKCVSTVLKCYFCEKPAIKKVLSKNKDIKWVCLDCAHKVNK